MARIIFSINFARGTREGKARKIAQHIRSEIKRGRLPGDVRLPGTRTLALSLKVSRNTVEAAYRELRAEGWISPQRAQGTFVCGNVVADERKRTRAIPEPGFSIPLEAAHSGANVFRTPLLQSATRKSVPRNLPIRSAIRYATSRATSMLRWDYGVPDVRLAPAQELARAYRRALILRCDESLQYGRYDRHAPSPLCVPLLSMLKTSRAIVADVDNIVVTRGSQMAFYLLAQVLLRKGEAVAVEHPGYEGVWHVLRDLGVHIVPIPVDSAGLQVDVLEKVMSKRRIKAIVTTPHHQFPTTVTMSAARRIALLRLVRNARVPIIEDDYDHEFHYDTRPVLPIAADDPSGQVIYLGSLSKICAPGLRLGYIVAPKALAERIRARRAIVDLHGDHGVEMAVAELFDDGTLQRHWRRARRIYQTRRDHLVSLLRAGFSAVLAFESPAGGMAIWAQVDERIDVEAWAKRALECGLHFRTGQAFFLEPKRQPFVRLGFAGFDESEMERAVTMMQRSLVS